MEGDVTEFMRGLAGVVEGGNMEEEAIVLPELLRVLKRSGVEDVDCVTEVEVKLGTVVEELEADSVVSVTDDVSIVTVDDVDDVIEDDEVLCVVWVTVEASSVLVTICSLVTVVIETCEDLNVC